MTVIAARVGRRGRRRFSAAIRCAQELVRRYVSPGRSLSRELIEQRRGERAPSLPFGRTLGVALLAFAPAVMAQPSAEERALAGLDRETGIWYPPDAPRQVYVDRSDPEHGFGKDVTEAFKKDPELRRAVCALVLGEEFEGVERRQYVSPVRRSRRLTGRWMGSTVGLHP